MALYRLSHSKILSDWCEIATETRFVFLALSPKTGGSNVWELSERGRAIAVLLGDKVSRCNFIPNQSIGLVAPVKI